MNNGLLENLARAQVFQDLPPGALADLVAASQPMPLAADQLLLGGNGALDHDVYIVVEGGICVFRETNPTLDILLGEVGPGGLVGEFAAICGSTGSARAKATMPSVVVRVPRERFRAVVQEHPQVALRLLEHLVGLVRTLDDRVAALKKLDQAVDATLRRLFLATL
jgi:CRP/FNR family cyclic AMP-dependent transcriptional regulator